MKPSTLWASGHDVRALWEESSSLVPATETNLPGDAVVSASAPSQSVSDDSGTETLAPSSQIEPIRQHHPAISSTATSARISSGSEEKVRRQILNKTRLQSNAFVLFLGNERERQKKETRLTPKISRSSDFTKEW